MFTLIYCNSSNLSFGVYYQHDIENSSIYIILCDGVVVWKTDTGVSPELRPASRRAESAESFLESILEAFSSQQIVHDSQQANMEPRFIFEVQVLEGSANLTIKEHIGGTKTLSLLLKVALTRDNVANPIVDTLFAQLSQRISSQSQDMKVLRVSAERDRDTIFALSREVEEAIKSKDIIQDHLIQKMCMVLNSKKEEIRRLRTELKAMEAKSGRSVEVGQPSPASATPARKTAVRKTASKAPKLTHIDEDHSAEEDESVSVSDRETAKARTRPKKAATSVDMMRVQAISRARSSSSKAGNHDDSHEDSVEVVVVSQDKRDSDKVNSKKRRRLLDSSDEDAPQSSRVPKATPSFPAELDSEDEDDPRAKYRKKSHEAGPRSASTTVPSSSTPSDAGGVVGVGSTAAAVRTTVVITQPSLAGGGDNKAKKKSEMFFEEDSDADNPLSYL